MTAAAAQATVALGVEYDGGAFHGFQRQRNAPSVQQALEEAASKVAAAPVRMTAAGRTDAGVHATQQVVTFDTRAVRSPASWRRGIGSQTPRALDVVWARVLPWRDGAVADSVEGGEKAPLNARFDALWRRYVYLYCDAPQRPVIARGQIVWSPDALDADAMARAARHLLGERDFSSFRASACQSSSPWRRVLSAVVARRGPCIAIDIAANAFVMHMVRNIAGALRAVGAGLLSEAEFAALVAARDRTLAPPTAPPHGLYLIGVGYQRLPLPSRPPPLLGVAAEPGHGA